MKKPTFKKIIQSKITKISAIIIAIVLISLIIWKILNKKTTETNIDLSFVQKVENIASPTFPNNVCNIVDYGASDKEYKKSFNDYLINEAYLKLVRKEERVNFEAFKKSIEDCSNKGGGTVKVPAGEWKVGGPIHLKSNLNLHLEENATISFSTNPDDFLPVVKTRYAGTELYNYSPMIYALDCENIAITGKGTIRGITELTEPNGWKDFINNKKKAEKRLYQMANENVPLEERIFGTIEDSLRPSLIQPYNCNNVLIEGVKIKEGPMWTLHALYTNNLIVRNVNIETMTTNNDGIVIDSSTNVLIENNKLATGDDAIAIKSGKDRDGWRVGKPSENIIIINNEVTEGHAAIAIGSEMSGNVRNVLIDNLKVEKSDRGIRIKSRKGRGGIIENIVVQNSIIKNSKDKPIQIEFDYGSKSTEPKTTKKPVIKNVEFRNIIIENNKQNVIEIVGLKNQISSILFKNIETKVDQPFISVTEAEFIKFENINNIDFQITNSSNLKIVNNICPKIEQEKSKNIKIDCEN